MADAILKFKKEPGIKILLQTVCPKCKTGYQYVLLEKGAKTNG